MHAALTARDGDPSATELDAAIEQTTDIVIFEVGEACMGGGWSKPVD